MHCGFSNLTKQLLLEFLEFLQDLSRVSRVVLINFIESSDSLVFGWRGENAKRQTEHNCLRNCAAVNPKAVYFLSDAILTRIINFMMMLLDVVLKTKLNYIEKVFVFYTKMR